MKSCLILTSRIEGSDFFKNLDLTAYDALLCADAGLQRAEELGFLGKLPAYYLGDYDSGEAPNAQERETAEGLILLPSVKDMTDSEAAIDLAVSEGFDTIHVLGGLGGRLDHTMGNLGMLAKYAEDPRIATLCFEDGQNKVFLETPGTFRIERSRFSYFGLIAYGGSVEGLTITGAKYPLKDHILTVDTTLGVSNEIASDAPYAEVTHKIGNLLVILSKD